MRLAVAVVRSLLADMHTELRDVEDAVSSGTREAGRGLRTELRPRFQAPGSASASPTAGATSTEIGIGQTGQDFAVDSIVAKCLLVLFQAEATQEARGERALRLLIQPAAHEPEQPLRHEDDHGDEDEPQRDQVVLREEA